MERKWKLYKHISPNGKVYIGITCQDVNKRWSNGRGYSYNKHFINAINKYGWDNFKHEILFDNLTEKKAKLLEQSYIHFYDSTNVEKGYNMTLGGEGTLGYAHTEESKRKMRELKKDKYNGENNPMYGKSCSEETKRKISIANTGRKATKETREKMSKSHKGKNHVNYGKHLSEETKRKISKGNKGKCVGENNPRARKIICITTGEIFNTTKQASEKYNIDLSGIIKCCKGKYKSAGELPEGSKLVWMYYEEYENYIKKGLDIDNLKTYDNKHYKKVICLTTSEVFDSIREASKKYNVNNRNISSNCKGKLKSAGKLSDGTPLQWMYYEEYLKEYN